MNWRTCASWRASFITLRSSSLTCCSTALRASSSGLIAAISSGRPSINSSARTAKTLNLARPMTRPRFLRRPRTWFSRSRLILTSSARLASSALTEWLSISWTSKRAGSADSTGTSSRAPARGQQPGQRECPPQAQVRREGTACRFHNERAMRGEPRPCRCQTERRPARRRPQVPLSRNYRRAMPPAIAGTGRERLAPIRQSPPWHAQSLVEGAPHRRAARQIGENHTVATAAAIRCVTQLLLRPRCAEVEFYAFDILVSDGEDLRGLPLSMRKANLSRLLARRMDGIFLSDFEQGEIGPDLFRHDPCAPNTPSL